jgi:UDP:flavonoid glycosyltransferase YjiC (YdhE family)
MFTQNGVGLGHVVRQLAISHHLSRTRDVIFASMSQAIHVIEEHGFQVEHIPSHVYTETEYSHWIGWTREQINQVIDFFDVGAAVLDSAVPYDSLIDAVAPRPDVKLVWIRRAMWRPSAEKERALAKEKYFDLVIEPADIAESRDKGPTVSRRHFVTRVDPIRFLDPRHLRSRGSARRQLGIDENKLCVLLQLGSGTNRNNIQLIDGVLSFCKRFDNVEVMLAEWLNVSQNLGLWPSVRVLSGFPISRLFNAFDFSVAAAGYNTFHEVISFGLPTLFVANPHPTLDDQVARADFADEKGAAISSGTDLRKVGSGIVTLLDESVRDRMKTAMRRLVRPNGARAAAAAIEKLLRDRK